MKRSTDPNIVYRSEIKCLKISKYFSSSLIILIIANKQFPKSISKLLYHFIESTVPYQNPFLIDSSAINKRNVIADQAIFDSSTVNRLLYKSTNI